MFLLLVLISINAERELVNVKNSLTLIVVASKFVDKSCLFGKFLEDTKFRKSNLCRLQLVRSSRARASPK